MRNLAIIPARSGSKGVKDKNIRVLNGIPLIGYSIKAAHESGLFDEIMVSTDSEEYAKTAVHLGASVPFLRSEETSSDTASSWDAVREVLINYKKQRTEFDTFALLQPTSPLRNAYDIRSAYKEFARLNAKTLTSVCEAKYSPVNCNTLPDDRSMSGFYKDANKYLRRQDIDKYYHENGAIYIGNTDYFLNYNDFYGDKCYAYIMSQEHSVDIDTELDFKYVELLIREVVKP